MTANERQTRYELDVAKGLEFTGSAVRLLSLAIHEPKHLGLAKHDLAEAIRWLDLAAANYHDDPTQHGGAS